MTTVQVQPAAPTARVRKSAGYLEVLFIGIVLCSFLVAFFVGDYRAEAVFLAIPTLLVCVWIIRAIRRWKTLTLRQRFYAGIEGLIFFSILVLFVVSVAGGRAFVRERNLRRLGDELSDDPRFAAISVEYLSLKNKFLRVTGDVSSENDLAALQETISSYDWDRMDGVDWNVTVRSSERAYKTWESYRDR